MRWRRHTPASKYEFHHLATFNAERARGIVHTPEWCERMAREQLRFDQQQRARYLGDPNVIVLDDDSVWPDITDRIEVKGSWSG